MSNANSIAVGGTHYKGVEIEHWDYTLLALDNRYLEGNITKYVARHRKKHGDQDLQKAKHYLIKLTEAYHARLVVPDRRDLSAPIEGLILRFCDQNELSPTESGIMLLMPKWRVTGDLEVIGQMIDSLAARYNQLSEPTSGYVNQGG